jgi:UDP-N-acetylmuramate dehydrogenase
MPPSYPDLVAHMAAERLSPSSVADVRRAVLAVRRTKGMVLDAADSDTRSVGSFFTNPVIPVSALDEIARRAGVRPPSFAAGEDAVKVPAAWLIERAGFHRGFAQGAAALSTKHPLAIVNRGGATAREVVALAAAVARGVETRFGVRLAPEPIFLGFGTDEDVAYLRAGAGAHVQV